MTRKDFQLLAATLYAASLPDNGSVAARVQHGRTVAMVTEALANAYPDFDRAHFVCACFGTTPAAARREASQHGPFAA